MLNFRKKYVMVSLNEFIEDWYSKNDPKGARWLYKSIKSNKDYMSQIFELISDEFHNLPFEELVYCFRNGLNRPPVCEECGGKLKFPYAKFCTRKCSQINQSKNAEKIDFKRKQTNIDKYGSPYVMQVLEIKEKYIKNSIDKYGVDWVSKSSDVKKKISDNWDSKSDTEKDDVNEKKSVNYKKSVQKKYGVDSVFSLPEIQKKRIDTLEKNYGVSCPFSSIKIRENIHETNEKKYGFSNPAKSEYVKNKTIRTNNIKYGYDYPQQNPSISKKISNKHLSNFIKIVEELGYVFITNEGYEISLKCPKCEQVFKENRLFLLQRYYFGLVLCTHCNPYRTYSTKENELKNFLSNFYENLDSSNRSILNGKEIDVYIPSLNIGFEFNGLYWHSEQFKVNYYHQEKKFQASEQGVNLIHIWEDDWEYKRPIIEARIKNVLGVTENKVFARKCSIVDVDSKTSKAFLEQNHIQGQVGAKRRLGLVYDGNLVSLMTFGVRNGKMEMLRFCNKLEFNVVGGFSRLLKHFRKEYNGEIYSYADLDWSNPKDNVYLRNGFEFVKKTEPGYFWAKDGKRFARQQFQKHKLVAQGFDASKTEDQIMIERGYVKIYNSGNLLYIFR